jgi:hypothetical protein
MSCQCCEPESCRGCYRTPIFCSLECAEDNKVRIIAEEKEKERMMAEYKEKRAAQRAAKKKK